MMVTVWCAVFDLTRTTAWNSQLGHSTRPTSTGATLSNATKASSFRQTRIGNGSILRTPSASLYDKLVYLRQQNVKFLFLDQNIWGIGRDTWTSSKSNRNGPPLSTYQNYWSFRRRFLLPNSEENGWGWDRGKCAESSRDRQSSIPGSSNHWVTEISQVCKKTRESLQKGDEKWGENSF